MGFFERFIYFGVRAAFLLGCGAAGGILADGIIKKDSSAGFASGVLIGLLCFAFRRISNPYNRAAAIRQGKRPWEQPD